MGDIKNVEEAVLEKFASRSEELHRSLLRLRGEWTPRRPPPYIVMADYAEQLAKDGLADSLWVEVILRDTEEFLESGGAAADLVAVGFLEALLGRAFAGRFDLSEIVHMLGPNSLEFCKAWDEHTGCNTVADAMGSRGPGF